MRPSSNSSLMMIIFTFLIIINNNQLLIIHYENTFLQGIFRNDEGGFGRIFLISSSISSSSDEYCCKFCINYLSGPPKIQNQIKSYPIKSISKSAKVFQNNHRIIKKKVYKKKNKNKWNLLQVIMVVVVGVMFL